MKAEISQTKLVLSFFVMVASNFKYHVDFPSPLVCQSILMSGKYRLLIRYTTFSTSRLNSFLSNGSLRLRGIPRSFIMILVNCAGFFKQLLQSENFKGKLIFGVTCLFDLPCHFL